MRKILLIAITVLWYGVGTLAFPSRISADPAIKLKLPLFQRMILEKPDWKLYKGRTAYLASVWMDGTRYDLKVDTASADTWVYSDLMEAHFVKFRKGKTRIKSPAPVPLTSIAAEDRSQPSFNCKKHRESAKFKGKFDLRGTNGADVKGHLGLAEKLTIGGMSVVNATVECVAEYSDNQGLEDIGALSGFDGVLGLGPAEANSVTPREYMPRRFFEKAFGMGTLKAITVDLYDDFEWKEPLSRVVINDCECDSRDPKTITTFYARDIKKWEFERSMDGKKVILDSSQNIITGAPDLVDKYYKNIKGAKKLFDRYWVPCDATLTPLKIPVDEGHSIIIDGKYLKGDVFRDCFGGFQYSQEKDTVTYGIPFFRSKTVCLVERKSLAESTDSRGRATVYKPASTTYEIKICNKPK